MAEPLLVEVVSPEKVLYSGEADMVITRTMGGGEIAFQAGHAPFLAALVENHTRVFQTDGTVQDIAVHRGFVEVSGSPTKVSILSDTAELAQDIDVERAKEQLEHHLHTLRNEKMDGTLSSTMTEAMGGRDRAIARLNATGTTFTA
jgi:F-type H+-transporting ATPase subunit epsilon